jgi:hypothetical protein
MFQNIVRHDSVFGIGAASGLRWTAELAIQSACVGGVRAVFK